MLHGKKGFDRIVWSFKNVLNQSMSWLFYDLAPTPEQDNGLPYRIHHEKQIKFTDMKTQIQSQLRVILHSGSIAPRSKIGWTEFWYRRYQA